MFFLFYALFLAIKVTVKVCWVVLALMLWLVVALFCAVTRQRAPRLHRFIDPV